MYNVLMETKQTFIVKRDGTIDSSFYKAIKREQQARYVKQIARVAVSKAAGGVFKGLVRMYSDVAGLGDYEALYGTPETKAEYIARMRNTRGQFVTQS